MHVEIVDVTPSRANRKRTGNRGWFARTRTTTTGAANPACCRASICVVRGGLLLLGLLIPAFGFAQGVPDEDVGEVEQAGELELVLVTGSRIKRRDFFSPSPLATIDREELAATGRATLEETLNQMPQVQPDLSRTVNNGGDGTATVNLRGIGAGRTLVLINGRRFAPSGDAIGCDIQSAGRSGLGTRVRDLRRQRSARGIRTTG